MNGLGSFMQGAAPQGPQPQQGMPQGQQGMPMPMPPANVPRMAAAMDVVEADIPESLKQLVSEKEFADKAKELLMSAGGQAAMNQTPPKSPTVAERVEKQAEEGVAGLLARLSPGIQQQGQQMAMAQRRAPMQGQRPPMQGQRPPMQGQRPPMSQQGVSGMPARNMMKAAQGGVVGFNGTEPVGSQVPSANTAQAINTANSQTLTNATAWLAERSIDAATYSIEALQALGSKIASLEGKKDPESVREIEAYWDRVRAREAEEFPDMNRNIEKGRAERAEQLAIQAVRDEALRAGKERGEVVTAEREAKAKYDSYFNQPALAEEALNSRTQEIYKKLPFRGSRNDSDRRSEARRLTEEELNFSSSRDKDAELEAYLRNSREVGAAQRNETQGLPALDMQDAPGASGAPPRNSSGALSNNFVGSSDLGGILSGTEQRAVNSSQAQVNPQFQNVLTEMPQGGTAPRATDPTQFDPNPPRLRDSRQASGIMPTAPVSAPVRQETPLEKALKARQIKTLGRDATAEGVAAGERYKELTGVEGLLAERKALQGEARGLREERFSPERMKKRTLRAGLARLGEKGLGGFGSGYTSERDLIDSERAAAAGISLAEVEKMITENRAMGMTQFEAENKARVEVDGIISEGGQIAQGMLATDQREETADLDRASRESVASARDKTLLAQSRITAGANQRVPTDTMSQLSIYTAQARRENSGLSSDEAASAGLALYNAAQERLGLAKLGLTQQVNYAALQSKALDMAIANINGRNPPVRPAEYEDLLEELVTKYAGQFTLGGGSTTDDGFGEMSVQ
jgi:hypothetical protein